MQFANLPSSRQNRTPPRGAPKAAATPAAAPHTMKFFFSMSLRKSKTRHLATNIPASSNNKTTARTQVSERQLHPTDRLVHSWMTCWNTYAHSFMHWHWHWHWHWKDVLLSKTKEIISSVHRFNLKLQQLLRNHHSSPSPLPQRRGGSPD